MPAADVVLEFEGESFLGGEAARAGLILLASLLLSFLFIRTSARLMRSPKVSWWPGSVETEGGLHVHHLVFGIVLLLATGFALALQPPSPWLEILAAGFGIGAGLTLDEYALWLHLDDVYWAEEGRRSVDAVVIAAVLGGLLLMGFLPFSTDDGALPIIITMLIVLSIAAVAILKGKIVMGVAGVLFPLVGVIGAIRLAKPGSFWAERRYKPGSRKLARAERRYERHTRRYQRFQDRVAGAPERPPV
jgi:hypothetical protein